MKKLIFLLVIPFLAITSCKKNEPGGTCVISGVVKHHSKIIGDATVYIKFNATEFPGADSSKYDTHIKADANGNYVFRCYKGDYYLYATGIDDRVPPLYVSGGVPAKVRHKEELTVDVAVTEKH
jgi:hypothetical protein